MSPLFILIPLLLIALSACSTSSAPPIVAPVPAPIVQPDPPAADPAPPIPTPPAILPQPPAPAAPVIPMPSRRVFAADWIGPSIGLTGFMTRSTPMTYSSGDKNAKWFTSPAEGLGGFACADPAPNAGYHTEDGCLVMTPGQQPPNTGFPIISAQTFSKDFHLAIDCEIWFDEVGQFGSYGGPVLDNGEPNYFALYGQNCDHASISLIIDQTVKGAPPMAQIAIGIWHTMQIHYYPDGSWRIAFDGVEYQPTGIDNPMPLKNDPHLSVFCGGFAAMKIRKLEVWSDDPQSTQV